MNLSPVVIFAHPTDADREMLAHLAVHAVSEQRVPVVLHPSAMPWYDGEFQPVAGPGALTLLNLVARHSGGRLWILLRPGEERADWPAWAQPAVRAWQRSAGIMPSRIRSGDPDVWARTCGRGTT